jgi:hypothetical protein
LGFIDGFDATITSFVVTPTVLPSPWIGPAIIAGIVGIAMIAMLILPLTF